MKIFRTALAVFLLGAATPLVYAREVNNPSSSTPDAWSVAGGNCYAGGNVTGCEVAVDFTGDLEPTVTGAQNLGDPLLQWANIYSVSAVNSGNETNGTVGATPATGVGGTAATQSTVNGIAVQAPGFAFLLTASSAVPVNSSLMIVGGSGASTTLTSQPEVSTTTTVGGSTLLPTGIFLTITSTQTAANIVFTSSTTSNATGLILGAATRTITKNKTLLLWLDNITNPGVWREIAFGNL